MRRILLSLAVCILSLLTAGAQQLTDTTIIYYRYGYAGIDPSYKDNKDAVQAFRICFAGLKDNPSLRPLSLHIDSYCSPEGTLAANERLSAKRAAIATTYIGSMVSGIHLTATSHGIDRAGAKAAGNTPPEQLYPLLRRSVITLTYILRQPDIPTLSNPLSGHSALDAGSHHPEQNLIVISTGAKRNGEICPLLSLKTNLLSWATLMPDFRTYTLVPNLELEWFFKDRWSLTGTGSFAKWAYGRSNYFGISSWSLEPRWWIWGDGRYRWLYIGMYGHAGDYDVQNSCLPLDGATGKFYGVGLSFGAAIPFTDRWGIEIGLRGGCRHSNVREYVHEAPHYYLENEYTDRHWGLTGLKASLYYRFGRSTQKTSVR